MAPPVRYGCMNTNERWYVIYDSHDDPIGRRRYNVGGSFWASLEDAEPFDAYESAQYDCLHGSGVDAGDIVVDRPTYDALVAAELARRALTNRPSGPGYG